jgi:transglutaminase-like putative cysteine protease
MLKVSHTTTYSYEFAARGMIQSLRMFPSVFEGQIVHDWSVRVETPNGPGIRGGLFRDGAGDQVEGWSVRGPVSQVSVIVEGLVETKDLSGVLRGHREIVPPEVYLRDTGPVTQADAKITDLAMTAVSGKTTSLAKAHALSEACAKAIAYSSGTTHANTTAAEAVAQGAGVCQDHAHALIAMARAVGMSARYVSGYLHASEDGSLHEAAHAWGEVYVGEGLGWIGFDPANNCCPDDRYIRLGSGYNATDAAPIKGLALGGVGQESLDVSVALDAVQQ